MKSFNRFNSSRNKSIKSGSRSSVDLGSAKKKEKVSQEKIVKTNNTNLNLDKHNNNLLNPYE